MSNHETELHDEMEIAEAQEMDNPEKKETDSIEKAGDATKKAPARKGDKAQGDMQADKADSGIVEAMKKKMKMSEEEDEMEDEDDEDDLDESILNELSPDTLKRYMVKSRADQQRRSELARAADARIDDREVHHPFGQKDKIKRDARDSKSSERNWRKAYNRELGQERATSSLEKGKKMMKKESYDFSEDAAMTGNYARVMYDYREDYYVITVYKNGKEVASDDGYFGANETGNPLIKKFTDLVKKAGLKPEGLPIVDEDGKKGVFKNNTFNWNVKESYDFSEDLDAIIADEATLSEEFKSKTAVIFEAAIKSKLREEVDRLEEQYEQRLTEELEQMSTDLIEKVDSYLDYAIDEWMKENEVALQNGIRNEIAEGFMSGLKELFEENYVDVPDSKIDLVDELAEQNEQLSEKANASIEEVLSLREELNNYKRDAIIREATRGLVDTQADKLAKLVEDIDFVDEETFIEKVVTIRDSYFNKTTSNYQLDEEADESELTEQTSSPTMQSYLTALRKSAKQ